MLKCDFIAEDLQQKILSNHYKPNDQLPTADELCKIYGVSKITVNKAMTELVHRGLVSRKRGVGSFVNRMGSASGRTSSFDWKDATLIEGTKSHYQQSGVKVRSVVHAFSVIQANTIVCDALGINSGFVYYICRSRFIEERPLQTEYTYMPISIIPGLSQEDVEDSIYQFIEHKLHLSISSSHSTIRAVLASPDECKWLGVSFNTPLLEVEQTAFLGDGTIFEYSVTRHTEFSEPERTVKLHKRKSG